MRSVALAVRRSELGTPSAVVVRAGVAFGYSVAVFTGVGLGLWLLIGLISLLPDPRMM